ncbi:MAG: SAM-dependent chlorinase/fluorinase [Armatimonadetes bacterium]|nr:SAM-dependent chlorinase/fluorinase [Armatimonadota bacterium]
MLITLLTDFGTRDTFVGVMKGVILSIAPDARLVDLTHHVPPQDVHAGAFALKTAYRYFPPGTVHLVVVDPGVGGARRPIAAHIGEWFFVGPDNGLLSHVLARETLHRAVTLDNARYHLPVSRTFHGRDIFAPAAACLAAGTALESLGTPTERLLTLPLSHPVLRSEQIISHVVYVDVFGNVFTDVTEDIAETWGGIEVEIGGGRHIPGNAASYSDVPEGQPLALFGSSGHLEIAVRNGNASRQLGLHVGDTVRLRRGNPPAK